MALTRDLAAIARRRRGLEFGGPTTLADPWLPPPDASGRTSPGRFAAPTRVARGREASPGAGYEWTDLPNVAWEQIARRLGTDPGACRLRYRFGTGDDQAPQNFEQALSDRVALPRTIEPNDRIAVWATRPDGEEEVLFDGFALIFAAHLDARSDSVAIDCLGTAYRLADGPVRGSLWRDGHAPLEPSDVEVDAEPHFNPKGRGNCCPDGEEYGDAWAGQDAAGDQRYPTFLDPDNSHRGAEAPTSWTLSKAARYLIFRHNPPGGLVEAPDGATLDAVLEARLPKDDVPFDYDDPATFDRSPITCPDKPIGGKDWPGTLHDLISDKGFAMAWDLDAPDEGDPVTRLRVFLSQQEPARPLWLQPRGSDLDLSLTNLGSAEIGRDLTQLVNEWYVDGDLEEKEFTVILACDFPTVTADGATKEALAKFDRSHPDFPKNPNKYRVWIADESGEGHYAPATDVLLDDPLDLDRVFGAPVEVDGEDVPQYARRRRPPIGELISRDPQGRPYKAQLAISFDYAGACPAVWDAQAEGSGKWRPVTEGWRLLKDRIGIELTGESANSWKIGKSDESAPSFKATVVNVVECLTKTTGEHAKFHLRLTIVAKGDRRVFGWAHRKLNDIGGRPIVRVIDAHDRYKKQTIVKGSYYALDEAGPFTEDVVARDDTAAAEAEAQAVQLATQFGVTGGLVAVPRLTTHYELGNRISHVQGRALGFRADREGPDAEPVYPVVTAITWRNGPDGQSTVLELSDANSGRHNFLRHIRRRSDARNA